MSDEDNDVDWVPYANRPEWSDTQPTPQDDGPNPIVNIMYTDKFRDVFDYFRTVLRTEEVSDRALSLTRDAAGLNPANYTVWHYRRRLLKELKKDIHAELVYVGDMIKEHLKTYQLWHHRRVLVEWLQDASDELQFTESVLDVDAKNYHAWQHRQWSISTFNLFENELEYVNRLLEEDVRNNSAWNQRYFVINNTKTYKKKVIGEEVAFTMDCIKKAVHNESAWNYLSGILFDEDIKDYPVVEEFTKGLYESGQRSTYLLAFMVDCLENRLEKMDAAVREPVLRHALEICDSLTKEHDTIRCEYWRYVARCLAQKFGTTTDDDHGDDGVTAVTVD